MHSVKGCEIFHISKKILGPFNCAVQYSVLKQLRLPSLPIKPTVLSPVNIYAMTYSLTSYHLTLTKSFAILSYSTRHGHEAGGMC